MKISDSVPETTQYCAVTMSSDFERHWVEDYAKALEIAKQRLSTRKLPRDTVVIAQVVRVLRADRSDDTREKIQAQINDLEALLNMRKMELATLAPAVPETPIVGHWCNNASCLCCEG